MILQKYRRQLGNDSITLAQGSKPFFVPSSFEHKHIDKNFVDIEFPQWFLDKHNIVLHAMKLSTNILIQSLCDLE